MGYGNWEDMSKVAKELWEIYLTVAKPQAVSRIAVRYINSLPIPLPIGDFSEYLNVPPVVPEGLPQTLASVASRMICRIYYAKLSPSFSRLRAPS